MATRGRPPSAKTLVDRQLGRNTKQPILPAGADFVIPNLSGEHTAGTTGTPTADNKIANKKYVDDEIDADIITHKGDASAHHTKTTPAGSEGEIQFNESSAFQADSNLFWDNVNKRLGIGTGSPVTKFNIKDGDTTFTQTELAHGMIAVMNDTSSFFEVNSVFDSAGGVQIKGLTTLSQFGSPLSIIGVFGETNPSDATPAINFISERKSGTTWAPIGVGETVLSVSNHGTKLITVKGNGNVGIGTTTPDTKLQVVGDTKFGDDNTNYMTTDSSGRVVFVGNAGLPYGTLSVVSNATETTITTQNVYVQVTNFDTNGVSNNTSPDHTADHITITKAGDYKIECCITANSVAGAGATFEFEIKKNNGNVRVGAAHGDRTLAGGGSEAGAITICTIATLEVNDTIELWTKNETNTQNIIIEDASLSVLQVGG